MLLFASALVPAPNLSPAPVSALSIAPVPANAASGASALPTATPASAPAVLDPVPPTFTSPFTSSSFVFLLVPFISPSPFFISNAYLLI